MDIQDIMYYRNLNGMGSNSCKNTYINKIVNQYNEDLDNVVDDFDVRINSNEAVECTVKGKKHRILFEYKNNKTAQEEEFYMQVQAYKGSIKTGDILEIYNEVEKENECYLVLSKKMYERNHEIFTVEYCNAKITWKGLNKFIYCVFQTNSYGAKGEVHSHSWYGDYDTRGILKMAMDEDTEVIYEGMRFILGSKHDIYEATKKMGATSNNIWHITLKFSRLIQEDDLENMIAYNPQLEGNLRPDEGEVEDVYTIQGESVMKVNEICEYKILPSAKVNWSIFNPEVGEIVSFTDTTCKVKALKGNDNILLCALNNKGEEIVFTAIYTTK